MGSPPEITRSTPGGVVSAPRGWLKSAIVSFRGPAQDGLTPSVVFEDGPCDRGQTGESLFKTKLDKLAASKDFSVVEKGLTLFLGERRPFVRYGFKLDGVEVQQTLVVAVKGETASTAAATIPQARHDELWGVVAGIIAGHAPAL